MVVKEIIQTKNEMFTIYDNGYIRCRKRQWGEEKFDPTQPNFTPQKTPEKPEKDGVEYEEHNF